MTRSVRARHFRSNQNTSDNTTLTTIIVAKGDLAAREGVKEKGIEKFHWLLGSGVWQVVRCRRE